MTSHHQRIGRAEISRFRCGCIYQTTFLARLYACPVHRAMLTGIEDIRFRSKLALRGLVMNPDFPNDSMTFINTQYNSGSSWKAVAFGEQGFHDDGLGFDEAGLCRACYVDSDGIDIESTRIGLCGCPDLACPNRWCGSISGLHAFYRMHVAQDYGQLASPGEESKLFDKMIFSMGAFRQTPPAWQEDLKWERKWLEDQGHRITSRFLNTLQQTKPEVGGWRDPLSSYPWQGAPKYGKVLNVAVRLICMGVISPVPEPWTQLSLPKGLML